MPTRTPSVSPVTPRPTFKVTSTPTVSPTPTLTPTSVPSSPEPEMSLESLAGESEEAPESGTSSSSGDMDAATIGGGAAAAACLFFAVVALVVVRRRRDAEKQEAFEDEATALEILKTEETKDIESYGAGLRAPSCTIAEFEVELRHVEDEPFARGGQGTVHLAEYQGEAVCLKKMSQLGMSAADRQRMFSQFSRELAIMVRLRSPRIVLVLGVVTTDPSYLGLVLEYLPGGSLRDALDAEGAVDAERQRVWSADVARGMAYLYKSRIEHRDLKSLNCLLTHDGRGKVCDFGLSKCDDLAATRATAGLCGTPAFMAPEYLDGAMFHQKCDVYSYAMVLYEIWTRGFPWEGLSPPQIIAKVVVQRLRPEVPPSIPRDMRARMTACWAHDASVRPSFKDIVTSLDASTPRPRTKGPWDHVPLLEGDAHVRPMRTYERSTVLKRVLESAELLHGDSSRSTLSRCSSGGSENLGVERRRLRDRLRDFGLREHAVAGDGNCQFRAIAHQLCGNDERHDAVRKRVVGQLALEPERYAEFCMVEDAEDADFESFVRRMADDGEWGDAVTLQAAADVYGVVVCLVTSYAERGIFRVEPRARLEAPRPDAPPIPNAPPPRSLGSREFDEEVAHVVSALESTPPPPPPAATPQHRTPPTAPPTILLAFWAESHYASIVPEEDLAGAAPS